jgi:glutamine amidotransferase
MKKLAIINYKGGNTASVLNAVNFVNQYGLNNIVKKGSYDIIISDNADIINDCEAIILPGVGSFGDCINDLKSLKINGRISDILHQQVIIRKKKFFGICVGMQILAEKGYEDGINQGLSWIDGEIVKIDKENQYNKNNGQNIDKKNLMISPKEKLRIPQMGWNNVYITKNHHLLSNINDGEHFYFANSYKLISKNDKIIYGYAIYGDTVNSIIIKDNIFATQFHPEKSGKAGLQIIANFLDWQ